MTLVPTTPTVEVATTDLAQLEHLVEVLEESLADAQLAAEDQGWYRLADAGQVITRTKLRDVSRLAQVMAIADPLIVRGLQLRTAYVWGLGVTIAATQEEDAQQDVNAVVQAFMDDPSNQATFTSAQAREELERRLGTQGQTFEALVTSPLSGRVQVRVIPDREIDDVITNPDDAADPWFYKRTYTRTVVEQGYAGTRTREETRTVYYPAVGYWPRLRPSTIDGKPVEWDKPVLHTVVNRPDGSKWGVPDLYAALPWAKGYKEFLEDWARYMKAMSRFAYQITAKTRRGAAQVRERIGAAPTNPDGSVGQTAITGEGQKLEAVGKSGATIDSDSGRPLAAMVAAALGVPVTMLLGDPGVTGARATAETLDQPTYLMAGGRRALHTARFRTILGYVIDQAIKAPQGPLAGTRRVDQVTGREVLELRGGQAASIDVDWPSLDKVDLKVLVDAINIADGTGKLPPLTVARLLLMALDVDNVDEILDQLTDGAGNFVYPDDAAAARAQQDAVAGGDQPAA